MKPWKSPKVRFRAYGSDFRVYGLRAYGSDFRL